MNRQKYISGSPRPDKSGEIVPGQVWQLKADSLERFRKEGKSIDYNIVIARANGDNVVSHLIHYIDHESLERETMWAAQQWKREVLEKGQRYGFPGILTITVRLFHKKYILEHYEHHDYAMYLLEHIK